MYDSYFNFSETPFELNLDQRFLFVSDDHKEVLAALSYFVNTKKGFAIVCGDVGTGKTMLVNSFLNTLPEYVQPVIVANPCVSSLELLRYIATTLKIEVREKDGILELTDAVKELLKKGKSLNKQFVLIIDEAHLLSDQALEEIRLLSNIETQDQKLLQILMVGQYELSYKLDRPEMRHLRQRININRFLSPLNSRETIEYIDHRLRQVGSSLAAVFKDNCGQAIYKMTGGVPRNINQLCDNALLICMGDMQQRVNRRILRKASKALLTDRLFTPKAAPTTMAPRSKLPRVLVWTAGSATCLVLGIVLSQNLFPGKTGQQPSRATSLLAASVPNSKATSAVPSARVDQEIPVTAGSEPSKREARESVAMTPKVLSSPKEKPGGGPVSKEVASHYPSSLPGDPPNGTWPADPPTQGIKPDAQPDNTQEPAFRRWEVKKGETLSIIASKAYRGSEDFGIEAVIFDNPGIKNRDLIHPGQVVFLPRINPQGHTMQLRDNLFYSYYGDYDSADAMKGAISLLEKGGVRYTTIASGSQVGRASHRILLGGYETAAALQKALDLVRASKK
jgi:type II secretory pathway predicted ATPase ExeA